jgi:hypothetical protein
LVRNFVQKGLRLHEKTTWVGKGNQYNRGREEVVGENRKSVTRRGERGGTEV